MAIRIDGDNATATPGITGGDADTGLVFGTDEIEAVTGGTTRFTVESNGNCTIEDGNLVVASGHGIDFSATADSASSMSNELLDDYEEGTFTITFTDGTTSTELGTSGTANNVATYIRVGRICTINIDFELFAQPGTGRVDVSGSAPFPSARPSYLGAAGAMRGFDSDTRTNNPALIIAAADNKNSGGSNFYLHLADGTSIAAGWNKNSDWSRDGNFNTPGLIISGSYVIAEGS